MATAYAALVSLMTTITMEQTQSPLHPPFPFPQQLIEALLERVRFLVDFLEQGWKGAEHLEPRITRLAYAAEDAIEIPIVDQIRSTSAPLGQDLESIIQELDSIKAGMMLLIKDKRIGMIKDVHPGSSTSSSTAHPQWEKTNMVGCEDKKSRIIEQLTWHQRSLQLIPIVGMGGIGKTTLARNVYDHEPIMKRFDARAWVSVSQEYNVSDILLGLLSSLENQSNDKMNEKNPRNVEMSKGILGDQVYKSLFDRRYLIIFDDMWSINVWEEIKLWFPDNTNGSRIIVTTRLTNLAEELSTFMLEMDCLGEEDSWNLFCEKVFAQKSCPLELERVGKKIARNCKGLPLGITVIGGLLAKSNMKLQYWEHVAEDFSSYLYSSDEDRCSKLLFLSYSHLPIHLKPCFLYLGVFPEDHVICVTKLMGLWIADGFIKPLDSKTLDEIAKEYLNELIERNLIMVSRWGWTGKIKYCIIHDLLRELCLREAQKEKFYCVVTGKCLDVPLNIGYQRRVVIRVHPSGMKQYSRIIDSLRSESYVRSLILEKLEDEHELFLQSPVFKLLRILFMIQFSFSSSCPYFNLVNMRYLSIVGGSSLLTSIRLFRNFQMLDAGFTLGDEPIEIWNMVQLHQVKCLGFVLPLPPYCLDDHHDYIVLENLLSLSTLVDFRFSEEVIKRIPNVKKLKAYYPAEGRKEWSYYSVHNLERLKKLESFTYIFSPTPPNRKDFLQNLAFTPSLKKLCLKGCGLLWDDMTVFGSMPHLEVLKLGSDSFVGPEWNPVEGEFRRLKVLYMDSINDLTNWNADSIHFPCLEKLYLAYCSNLEEIPPGIGDISTLQLIWLYYCSYSLTGSVKKILKEQQSLGNDELVVKIYTWNRYKVLFDPEFRNFASKSM